MLKTYHSIIIVTKKNRTDAYPLFGCVRERLRFSVREVLVFSSMHIFHRDRGLLEV